MTNILIINPNPDTNTNPTLVFLLGELVKDKTVNISLAMPFHSGKLSSHLCRVSVLEFVNFRVTWPKKFWKSLQILVSYVRLVSYCKKNAITKIIAVDPVGLVIAGRVKSILKSIELHYLSFEIFFNDELTKHPGYRSIKDKEVYYSKLIDVLIIQDSHRKELLLGENKFENTQLEVFQVPVAPLKYPLNVSLRKENRKKLGVEPDETLLFFGGSVQEWSGAKILIEILEKGLPSKHRLIVHSKNGQTTVNKYIDRLRQLQYTNYPVIVSEEFFLDYEAYLNFMQCADFGLAFYVPDFGSPFTGENIRSIGLASGKFACYMSAGIPAIVTNAIVYKELNEKYGFGYLIKDASELIYQLDMNNRMPGKFSQVTIDSLYSSELDPEIFGRKYLRRLNISNNLDSSKKRNSRLKKPSCPDIGHGQYQGS